MARFILVAIIATVLVNDSYLCAAVESEAPCTSAPSEPCRNHPPTPTQDTCYDCVCQGATLLAERCPHLEKGHFSTLCPSLFTERVSFFRSFSSFSPTFGTHLPCSGRALRELLQSFLI